jgi:hypothetical protein
VTAVKNLFETIESHRFSAAVNVVSGYRAFVRAVGLQPEVQRLRQATAGGDGPWPVFDRLVWLLIREADEPYENPWDAAVAVYLWLLATSGSPLTVVAAAMVSGRPGYWWARKMAQKVGGAEVSHFSADNVAYTLYGRPGWVAAKNQTRQTSYLVVGRGKQGGRQTAPAPPVDSLTASGPAAMRNGGLFQNRDAASQAIRPVAQEAP